MNGEFNLIRKNSVCRNGRNRFEYRLRDPESKALTGMKGSRRPCSDWPARGFAGLVRLAPAPNSPPVNGLFHRRRSGDTHNSAHPFGLLLTRAEEPRSGPVAMAAAALHFQGRAVPPERF